jgi:hypothetical protein
MRSLCLDMKGVIRQLGNKSEAAVRRKANNIHLQCFYTKQIDTIISNESNRYATSFPGSSSHDPLRNRRNGRGANTSQPLARRNGNANIETPVRDAAAFARYPTADTKRTAPGQVEDFECRTRRNRCEHQFHPPRSGGDTAAVACGRRWNARLGCAVIASSSKYRRTLRCASSHRRTGQVLCFCSAKHGLGTGAHEP